MSWCMPTDRHIVTLFPEQNKVVVIDLVKRTVLELEIKLSFDQNCSCEVDYFHQAQYLCIVKRKNLNSDTLFLTYYNWNNINGNQPLIPEHIFLSQNFNGTSITECIKSTATPSMFGFLPASNIKFRSECMKSVMKRVASNK